MYGYVPEFGDSNTGPAGAQPDFFGPGISGFGEVSIVRPDELNGYDTGAAAVAGTEYEPSNAGFDSSDAGYASSDAGYASSNAGYEGLDAVYADSNLGYESSDAEYEGSNLGYEPTDAGHEGSSDGFKGSAPGYEASESGYGTGEVLSAVGSGEPVVYQEFQIRKIHLSI